MQTIIVFVTDTLGVITESEPIEVNEEQSRQFYDLMEEIKNLAYLKITTSSGNVYFHPKHIVRVRIVIVGEE